jgi:hypothetical protein
MRKSISLAGLFSILIFYSLINSCSKGGGGSTTPPNPCAGITVLVTATVNNTTGPGQSNGMITASASGGSGFQYSINNGPLQASGIFNNLTAGSYTILAKNSNGCIGSATFIISDGDPCALKNIVVNNAVNGSDKCSSTGIITVTATGSTGFTYQLNAGAFQASNIFSNLAVGNYTITVKDLDNCTKTAAAVISELPAGPLFSQVRTIIHTNCALSGCHAPPSPQNGIDFTQDCVIVANKDRIKARAVDGNPSFMPPPPNPQLSAANKQAIVNWINAGGRYTD